MPRECMAYIKYKGGNAVAAIYRLVGGGVFSLAEMRKWIMEDDSEVVGVKVSKVPDHLRKGVNEVLERLKEEPL